jgi:predicted unusual protein kinase regulating ubiquinone biosynthesis (AarF/ABC1/UbiB family)
MAWRHARWRLEAESLRRLALGLGGLMIKVGQAVAARADLFPREYVTTLATLEDRVPPRPFPGIRRQLERELGRPVRELFRDLDERPLAAASLAQVHRGRLHDGREVAVKVLYPGVEEQVLRDLGLVRWMLPFIVRTQRGLQLDSVVDEIARSVPAELDLVGEGRNAERVDAVLRHRADVVIPAIVWEYTTRRVLVMDYIDGVKITDVEALRAAGIDTNAMAEILVDAYCEQILGAGFFQADPHPGNLLVLPGPRLAILDFGLCKALAEPARLALGELIQAVLCEDEAGTLTALRTLGFRAAGDAREPMLAIAQLFLGTTSSGRGYADVRLVAEADRRLQAATAAHPLVIPGEVTLVARVMGTLSGIGRQLESRVNVPLSMLLHG